MVAIFIDFSVFLANDLVKVVNFDSQSCLELNSTHFGYKKNILLLWCLEL